MKIHRITANKFALVIVIILFKSLVMSQIVSAVDEVPEATNVFNKISKDLSLLHEEIQSAHLAHETESATFNWTNYMALTRDHSILEVTITGQNSEIHAGASDASRVIRTANASASFLS